jgi:4-diphosphocytidyl-2-C-methyl-D-erythritol kinase
LEQNKTQKKDVILAAETETLNTLYNMISYPNAKINLGLNVVEDRPDGYHNLETVFYPIPLCDTLEVTLQDDATRERTGGRLIFEQDGMELNDDGRLERNLVVRVLRRVQERFGVTDALRVYLKKTIPSGAGLGGGSADASFMLKMLVEMFHLPLSTQEMIEMMATIGADCPFFILNRPVYAQGIGELMEEIPLSLKDYHLALVKPNDHISTAEAFAHIVSHYPENRVKDVIRRPVPEWRDRLVNDFEASIFPQHPTVVQIKETLYRLGADYATMTGSGSSIVGLFKTPPTGANEAFKEHFYYVNRLF